MQTNKHPVEMKHFMMGNNFAVVDTYNLQYTVSSNLMVMTTSILICMAKQNCGEIPLKLM